MVDNTDYGRRSLWSNHNPNPNIYSFAIFKKLKLRLFEILVLYDGVVWSTQVMSY